MRQSKVDLIMHPLRMRILMVLNSRQMTTQQIAAALADVPKASLYRHMAALTEGGVLCVVAETPTRGAVERTYALTSPEAMQLTQDEIASLSKETHLRLFTVFMTQLMRDFARYLDAQPQPDFAADGVGYHTYSLYLSDDELAQFGAAFQQLIQPYLEPGPGRKPRRFATVILPEIDDDTRDSDSPD